MEKPNLNNIKNEIRSLLISSPYGVSMKQLLRDYKCNIGKPLPYQEFGCSNPLHFLSCLSDVVKMEIDCDKLLLSPVEAPKSSHVNAMVINQRTNRNSASRRTIPLLNSSYNAQFSNFNKSGGEGVTSSKSSDENVSCHERQHSVEQNEVNSNMPARSFGEYENQCNYFYQRSHSTPKQQAQVISMAKEQPQMKSYDDGDRSSDGPDFSKKSTIYKTEDGNLGINEKMKQNLRGILADHPDGLLLSRLPQKYEERFLNTFSSQDYGYFSLKEFVLAMPDVFRHEKHKLTNDWLLFDANTKSVTTNNDGEKWIPKNILDNIEKLVRRFPNGIYGNKIFELYEVKYDVLIDVKDFGFESISSFLVFCQSVDCRQENDDIVVFPKQKPNEEVYAPPALPSMREMEYLWKTLYPNEVCGLWDNYTPFQLPPGPIDYLKVLVVDVANPHHIWMQLLNKVQDVCSFMNDLNIFYDSEEADYVMRSNCIRVGQMCVARFFEDKRWHRAIITQLISSTHTEVLYVDYGTQLVTRVTELRYLHKKFSVVPIQAIKGEMTELTWPEGEDIWPLRTNSSICDLAFNKALVAEVVHIHFDEPKLEIILYDTNTSEDLCLNNDLLNRGLAIYSNVVYKTDSSDLVCNDEGGIRSDTDVESNLDIGDEEEVREDGLEEAKSCVDEDVANYLETVNISNFKLGENIIEDTEYNGS